MNKAQFLRELRANLAGKVPPDELNDVLSYYEAYFEDSEEDEERVAERLGSPASVAEQVLREAGGRPRVSTPPPSAGGRRPPVLLWVIVAIVAVVLVVVLLSSLLLLRITPDLSRTPAVSESTTPVLASEDSDRWVTLSPFDTLDLNVDVANIQVEEGDGWHLRLVNQLADTGGISPYELHYQQTEGTLSIWSTQDRTNQQNLGGFDIRVELTVPAGTVLDQARVSLGVGSLDWEGCAVNGLLRAENGVGELDVSARVGEAELSTGVGDVALEVAGDQADYTWKLDTGVGDIRLNGAEAKPFTFSASGGQGEGALSLSAGTGDVSLDFQ